MPTLFPVICTAGIPQKVLREFFSVNQDTDPCLCLLDSSSPKEIKSLNKSTKPDDIPEQLQYPFQGQNNLGVLTTLKDLIREAKNDNLSTRFFVILDDQTLNPSTEKPSCLIGGEDISSEEKHVLFVRAAFANVNIALGAYSIGETSISHDLRSQEMEMLEF